MSSPSATQSRAAGSSEPPPIRWSVKPDPATALPKLPDDQEILIHVPPSFFGGEVTFPAAPSPFVAVGRNGDNQDVREIWTW